MREIKFRIKTETGWFLFQLPPGGKPSLGSMAIGFPAGTEWKTIGQFTGLKDRHGKEIYEGDILKGYEHRSNKQVLWESKETMFVGRPADGWAQDWEKEWEVIGNIHENPELLGGRQ